MENNFLVTITVCTYKRPEMVVRCLRSLIAQQTDFSFDIVVVENDAAQGSREVIEALIPEAAEKGIALRYYCESVQNISAARNRCVAECQGEFLAMMDDDEWAAADWAQKLMDAQRETGADVVSGCVEPLYEDGFPNYLKDVLLWYRGPFVDKQSVMQTATNSSLFRKSVLETRPEPFDLQYGKSGGEDTELSFYLISQGVKMVKTSQAVVYEVQPLSRASMMYYWRRIYREGHLAAGIHVKYYYRMNGTRVNAWVFFKGGWEILKAVPLLLVTPRKAIFRMGFHACRSLGILAWYLGFKKIDH